MRWRTYTDRLLVLAIILAAWQVGSFLVGPYWLSSPAAVAARFTAQIWSGELLIQGGYTIEESLIGTVVGGVPAVLLPFLLRRHPVMVAILDPFMVGGYGAPKLAFGEAVIAREIIFKSLQPFFFTGLKVALPRAVSATIVGEFLVATQGVGTTSSAPAKSPIPSVCSQASWLRWRWSWRSMAR